VKESISATTKGNIVSLSRQAIVNDDMGIFSRIAAQLGRAAALSIEMDVYDLLALNAGLGPLMNDGLTLFHATHLNIGTGAALSVMQHPKRLAGQGMKIGVIGLGTGSMAAHGKAGDKMYFYDIDPKIVAFAHKYFTYLDTSPAKPEVILGDARIKMEQQLAEGSQNYDVIVLDAFSGDAIPAHLLTYESFALYDKHLHHDTQGQPDGVIVIHISNRYLDLEPVVYAIADKYGYDTVNVHASGDGSVADTASDWVLVSKNKEFINNPVVRAAGEPLKVAKPLLWTDQFTALFPILK